MSKVLSLLLAFTFFMTSCSSSRYGERRRFPSSIKHMSDLLYSENVSEKHKELIAEINEYQKLVEETLVWRVKALEFLDGIENKIKTKSALSSEEVKTMHFGADFFSTIRDNYYKIVDEHKWMMASNTEVSFTNGKTEYTTEVKRNHRIPNKKIIIKINPKDDEGKLLIKKFMYGLSAATMLYDNYIIVVSQFERIKKLRRLIDADNDEENRILTKSKAQFGKFRNKRLISKAISMFRAQKLWDSRNDREIDDYEQYLSTLIVSSALYDGLPKVSVDKVIQFKFRMYFKYVLDFAKRIMNFGTHHLSKVFGNTVGLVETRKGYLYKMSQKNKQLLESQMQPLDVLLEKTPFRLTDKFIPGHWGHVAIWTGSPEQLIELGVWFEPEVVKYHDKIKAGHKIIEALRPGVQINTLSHFLNVDDFAAIRFKDLTEDQKRKYMLIAFRQIGKDYDFNFDVETDEKIVCSELAYVVYEDMSWPVDSALGRYTISPDHVAEKVLSGEMNTEILFHDGKKVQRNINENYGYLMSKDYDKVYFK